MTVEKVMVTNGLIVGAVINDNGIEKKARLTDLQKLIEKGKITAGAKLINDTIVLDADVLKNKYEQASFKLDSIVKDDSGTAIGVILKDGRQVDMKTTWSLAADDRLEGLQAAYMKDIDSKVIIGA